MRRQMAVRRPDQLFGGQPAHALDEAALDLAQINGRIKRAADIVQDIDPVDAIFAGQDVDGDFRDRGAIGEIIKRPAAPGFMVVMDLRGLVEAGR